ncbi:hypothetical protein ACLBXM_20180 [Xanthobacteraceae bacterium A53D]
MSTKDNTQNDDAALEVLSGAELETVNAGLSISLPTAQDSGAVAEGTAIAAGVGLAFAAGIGAPAILAIGAAGAIVHCIEGPNGTAVVTGALQDAGLSSTVASDVVSVASDLRKLL